MTPLRQLEALRKLDDATLRMKLALGGGTSWDIRREVECVRDWLLEDVKNRLRPKSQRKRAR